MPDTSHTNSSATPPLLSRIGSGISSLIGRFWVVALVFGLVWYLVAGRAPTVELEDGRTAPDFTLESLEGTPVQLSDYRGRVVVLNLWATWCVTCKQQMPGFVEMQDEFESQGVQFIGLSVDTNGMEVVRAFIEEQMPVNYPIVNSPRVASQQYGTTRGVPRTYIIDRSGTIRYEHTGLLLPGDFRPVLQAVLQEGAVS
ncbi:MAG: TlpA disulfide reductase family protein [Longimonas sp.]|uniref:redoxin domain-containing protein n=1 Tax=Longimonas sp. TaxID=2039626 RepID=UPI003976E7D1